MKNIVILFLLLTSLVKAQSPLCPSTSTNFGYEYVAGITINGQYYAGNTGFASAVKKAIESIL